MPDLDLTAIKDRTEAVTQRHGLDSDHEQVWDMSGDPNGCCVCNARNYRPDYALVSLFAQANADILALVTEVERLQLAAQARKHNEFSLEHQSAVLAQVRAERDDLTARMAAAAGLIPLHLNYAAESDRQGRFNREALAIQAIRAALKGAE